MKYRSEFVFDYPDEVAAPASLTRERALHMFHNAEAYQAAHQAGELKLPGGNNGVAWKNFLEQCPSQSR